ncbi:MAG: dicarboxylate/amino acid:cation symporter [gamma proteobacterium symbiont of Bathyaustriella thionipta]|nr:dicarboxylate/amino acid:cation symporter [gamma proteobacterium symbiont of Bathyaustriella thionipta]
MPKLKLHWQILIALALALVCGWLLRQFPSDFSTSAVTFLAFIGQLFLNALKMIILPLILASMISGIGSISDNHALGRIGGKTLGYYLTTSLIAILTGLLLVNLIQPGIVDGEPVKPPIDRVAVAEKLQKIEGRGTSDIAEVLLRMVPSNVLAAASDNKKMLGVIFFGLLFGFFMSRIGEKRSRLLQEFWHAILDVMLKITDFVMLFAPVGVFALVGKVVASTGFDQFESVGWFFMTVLLALMIHVFISMPLLLSLVAKVNPLKHFRALTPALLTAFSTASSSATLPLTMESVQKNAGVSQKVSSFVLPLGATVNMDGTALYECVAAMFIAQAFGLELSFTTQFTIVFIALITSIGVAGIPSASLVAIGIILMSVGLPLEAIGMILVVDRILDMFRTAVNVFSDSCGAVIIAATEGERGQLYPDSVSSEPA